MQFLPSGGSVPRDQIQHWCFPPRARTWPRSCPGTGFIPAPEALTAGLWAPPITPLSILCPCHSSGFKICRIRARVKAHQPQPGAPLIEAPQRNPALMCLWVPSYQAGSSLPVNRGAAQLSGIFVKAALCALCVLFLPSWGQGTPPHTPRKRPAPQNHLPFTVSPPPQVGGTVLLQVGHHPACSTARDHGELGLRGCRLLKALGEGSSTDLATI